MKEAKEGLAKYFKFYKMSGFISALTGERPTRYTTTNQRSFAPHDTP
jgi:hypothetical protein